MTTSTDYNGSNDLNHNRIVISSHAMIRIRERLGINKNNSETTKIIRSYLKDAKYIGIVLDEDNKEGRLYAHNGVAYYITLDKKCLMTVTKETKTRVSLLQNKVIDLYKKEIRKLTRKESARLKRLYELELKNKMDVATLEYKIHRSRSPKAKAEYNKQIEQLNKEFELMQKEIDDIRKEKKKLSKSLVAII